MVHPLALATVDALPFALVGAVVAFLGGRRLAGPGLGLLLAGLGGGALLIGLAAVSLADGDERPLVCSRTAVDILFLR